MRERPTLAQRIHDARNPQPERETRSDPTARRFVHRERPPMGERPETIAVPEHIVAGVHKLTQEILPHKVRETLDSDAEVRSQAAEAVAQKTVEAVAQKETEMDPKVELDRMVKEIKHLESAAPPRRGFDTVKENPQLVLAVIGLVEKTSTKQASDLTGYSESSIRSWTRKLDGAKPPKQTRPVARKRQPATPLSQPMKPKRQAVLPTSPQVSQVDELEAEIGAMAAVAKALEGLSTEAAQRVMEWVSDRLLPRRR